jgi:hypothetical protein
MSTATSETPTVFVSYSWDDEDHKAWAHNFGQRLSSDGVLVTLDQWSTVPGDQLPVFMETAIGNNKFVLIICTPRYKTRSEQRQGGVGYEGDIITAQLLHTQNQRKFIPVLRQGDWLKAAPSWLAGKYYVDLRDGPQHETQYQDLLNTLYGTRPQAPVLGKRKSGPPEPHRIAMETPPSEPVRILGIIADEVTRPRNDGTRGSSLYSVPFRLSRPVASAWAQTFMQVWDRPPQFSTMHRPGIARVSRDRIVLEGTTIEEVQKYHRDTLILCVEETNRLQAEHEKRVQAKEATQLQDAEAHRKRVQEVSDQIKWD